MQYRFLVKLGLNFGVLILFISQAQCDSSYRIHSTPRFTMYLEEQPEQEKIISLATTASTELNSIIDEYSRIFVAAPPPRIVLKFLSPTEFVRTTGAPAWTSAMFYRGEISVPIPINRALSKSELTRALRHEYTHNLIAEMSNYRCPAWLDEGLAQIMEGRPNPLLGPALRRIVNEKKNLPLESLSEGFTTFKDQDVPGAYAHSLFVTRKLLTTKGMSSITKFLGDLKSYKTVEEAFSDSFGEKISDFEMRMNRLELSWSKTDMRDP